VVIDEQAESCTECHQQVRTGEREPMIRRTRFFDAPDGRRLLGSTRVIANEPSCSSAACHAHEPSESVLGVLDIIYPLTPLDQAIKQNTVTIAGFSVSFALAAALLAGFLIHRMIYIPMRDLEGGAKAVSAGHLGKHIPVRGSDEFSEVAQAFNDMSDAVNASQSKLEEWAQVLEQRIEEKTRELQIAQAEAIRGEKLASVGLLAAGIAHELNNPLTGVLTFSTLVRKELPDDSPEAEDLDLVIKETKRCATIIRRLLDFAREKAPEKDYCDLNQLLTDAAELIEQPARFEDIEVVLDLDLELPVIWIDEDLVKQVVMNMLVNAEHAIGEKGRITLRTRRCAEKMSFTADAEPVEMVEIIVEDTGCGIPQEDLSKIFDPFFTTKGVGKGTGLGLSVSHGAVLAHGGDIRVESEVGKGTTFHVFLPIGTQGKER
jgi:two-component system NtrC family sensor kinase